MLHKLCAALTRHRWGKRIASSGGASWYICRVCGTVERKDQHEK